MDDVIERNDSIQIRMPAVLENIDRADEKICEFIKTHQLPIDLFAVRILLREALLNAVTHGSGKNPKRSVYLFFGWDESGVELVVKDHGPGFAWQTHRGEFDVLGDGGRGLALMRIYSDEMSYNDCGNQVRLRKRYSVPADGTVAQSVSTGKV